jgi:hypothetical protein
MKLQLAAPIRNPVPFALSRIRSLDTPDRSTIQPGLRSPFFS